MEHVLIHKIDSIPTTMSYRHYFEANNISFEINLRSKSIDDIDAAFINMKLMSSFTTEELNK